MEETRNTPDFPWEIVETADGSLTLQETFASGVVENMHNRAGAVGETLSVFGPLLREAGQLGDSTLIAGMGAGTIELVWAAFGGNGRLVSAESRQELRTGFTKWVQGENSPLSAVVDQNAAIIAMKTGSDPSVMKAVLRDALACQQWTIEGKLETVPKACGPFSSICFDLYSSKTQPDCWTEAFFDRFLETFAAPDCVFATWASMGNLRRALLRSHFNVERVPGFGPRRESIRARRCFDSVTEPLPAGAL